MYLFFDTETVGVPKNYKAPWSDTQNWPRMIQLGFILQNTLGQTLVSANLLIKPVGFEIPEEATRVHGITTEKAMAEGVDLAQALLWFRTAMCYANVAVGHNIDFDAAVVFAEFQRKKLQSSLELIDRICTMKKSANHLKLPNEYGYASYKWPKLQELHEHLFGESFTGAHDAMADITATARCFWELKRLGVL